MNESEVRSILSKKNLSTTEGIEVFNWYLINKSKAVSCIFPEHPELGETWLHNCKINTVSNLNLLEYSIKKIKEELGIVPKSEIELHTWLMGFR